MTYIPNVNTDRDIAFDDPGFNVAAKWNIGAFWSVAGGLASLALAGDVGTFLTQTKTELIVGNWYDVTFTLANTFFNPGEGIVVTCGGISFDFIATTDGTFTIRIQCRNLNQELGFTNSDPTAFQSCDLDNVSVVAVGTAFYVQTGIDYRTPRAAVIQDLGGGEEMYQALCYKDKTNCMIKYTPT